MTRAGGSLLWVRAAGVAVGVAVDAGVVVGVAVGVGVGVGVGVAVGVGVGVAVGVAVGVLLTAGRAPLPPEASSSSSLTDTVTVSDPLLPAASVAVKTTV